MKKKLLITFVCFAAFIVILWVTARLTGMLQFYSIPTSTNEPTIKQGSLLFSSNLITPKQFDFICYLSTKAEYKDQLWVHRLCGLPGDTVEIKNGNLFVNGASVDNKFTLAHDYLIARKDYTMENKLSEDPPYEYSEDSIIVLLRDQDVQLHKINATRYVYPEAKDPSIDSIYSKDWSVDNFGPIVIPVDKYFVLGDNRNRSFDSRFTGLIPKENLKGVVLGK